MIRNTRDVDGSSSQGRFGAFLEQCLLERLECGGSRLVQSRKPDADSLVELDGPCFARKGCRTESSHVVDDVLARNRLGTSLLDDGTERACLMTGTVMHGDFERLALPHVHVNRNRNLHPRLGAFLRIGGELGRAHAKHAVANGYRFADAQILRLALECIGRLDGVGNAALRSPELEQVAHGDVSARGELHLAG